MQIEYELKNIDNILSYSQDKKYISWDRLSSILDKINPVNKNEPSKKELIEVDIKKVINHVNNSNKLPNINKEIPVEFRGFSKEEIRQRDKTGEKGYSIYLIDEQKIIVDETEVRSLSEYEFLNSN